MAVSIGMLHKVTTPPSADMHPQDGGNKLLARIDEGLKRSLYFLYIVASLFIGIFLLYLPWSPYWGNNYLLYLYPQFRPLVANPFFKGFVLGLGIVDILLGIHEVAQPIHHWKAKHFPR